MQVLHANRVFGNTIRKLRKAAGLTQEQTAARLQLLGYDLSRSVYAQIECGIRHIRVEEIVALKRIFGVSYDTLFSGFESE